MPYVGRLSEIQLVQEWGSGCVRTDLLYNAYRVTNSRQSRHGASHTVSLEASNIWPESSGLPELWTPHYGKRPSFI